jgi:hypothetical protein
MQTVKMEIKTFPSFHYFLAMNEKFSGWKINISLEMNKLNLHINKKLNRLWKHTQTEWLCNKSTFISNEISFYYCAFIWICCLLFFVRFGNLKWFLVVFEDVYLASGFTQFCAHIFILRYCQQRSFNHKIDSKYGKI